MNTHLPSQNVDGTPKILWKLKKYGGGLGNVCSLHRVQVKTALWVTGGRKMDSDWLLAWREAESWTLIGSLGVVRWTATVTLSTNTWCYTRIQPITMQHFLVRRNNGMVNVFLNGNYIEARWYMTYRLKYFVQFLTNPFDYQTIISMEGIEPYKLSTRLIWMKELLWEKKIEKKDKNNTIWAREGAVEQRRHMTYTILYYF